MSAQIRPARWIVAILSGAAVATLPAKEARLSDAFAPSGQSWAFLVGGGAGEPHASPTPRWRQADGRIFVEPGAAGENRSIVAYTIPSDGAGFYTIKDSLIRRDSAQAGRIELQVSVQRGAARGSQPPPAVLTHLDAGELFDFDTFLGYLDAGDTVRVSVGPAGEAEGDRTEIDFSIAATPAIPVSVFPEDLANPEKLVAPGAWSVSDGVTVGSAVARRLAWGRAASTRMETTAESTSIAVDARRDREALAAFRVPHSGYYALHNAWVAADNAAIVARVYIGDESRPRREVRAEPLGERVNLNAELGYVQKGDVVYLAFSGTDERSATANVRAKFGGDVIEWAPRRAPLRVRRGKDGYLDVFEPEAPRHAIDIPAERWITVPAMDGDATTALRDAFERARVSRTGDDYVGIRLGAGATYVVASAQVGGTVFPINNAQRLVFDGNGATLRVASPELTRKEVDLFSVTRSRNIVFADFVVEATSVPFTTGEILGVSPRGENTQTVTFRVDEGELDPLKDISRDGRNNAYAYDSHIPGRLALGSWTHYPGTGNPSIQATNTPGVFTHRVTRTNDSIEPGGKWLIKNKRGGVVYLTTRAGAENVTLSGIDGRASGGGHLRFWQTSGVNILNCRFEPEGNNWISSSADGVHGRGREGVWIEDTLIRGVCEDIMNTYGQNMIVEPDENNDDAVMNIRMFTRSSESFDDGAPRLPTEESLTVGDQLVFFDPRTGRVQGYAGVVSIANGRYTLTNPVPGIDPWDESDGKNATMVYNTHVAGRFFVRDTRMMDSMRFGVYIKARGGVVFGSQFEGLSAPPIFAVNEPEWPEGPPATHLWVQGCTFSQNNYGYMPRHRDFMVVDPADISVYTRRFRAPSEPDDYRANLTRGQYANSHMKFIGNVFHDWRGMGISVRNSRNARIEDNVFLSPVNDETMRKTLAEDPAMSVGGHGGYAAIFLDSVGGARVSGNWFHGLPAGDRGLVEGEDVDGLILDNNVESVAASPTVSLSFDEWFGDASVAQDASGASVGTVALGGAVHRAGRLGGGVFFAGGQPASFDALRGLGGASLSQFSLALWVCPEDAKANGTVFVLGSERDGVVFALENGRWRAAVRNHSNGGWLDLGSATSGQWQHLAVVFDGGARVLHGYVDGVELTRLSGWAAQVDLPANGELGGGTFRGGIDEVQWTSVKWSDADIAALALRRSSEGSR